MYVKEKVAEARAMREEPGGGGGGTKKKRQQQKHKGLHGLRS